MESSQHSWQRPSTYQMPSEFWLQPSVKGAGALCPGKVPSSHSEQEGSGGIGRIELEPGGERSEVSWEEVSASTRTEDVCQEQGEEASRSRLSLCGRGRGCVKETETEGGRLVGKGR